MSPAPPTTPRRVHPQPRVAVLVPCHNESTTVEAVVRAFQQSLPEASVVVYDNASDDETARIAEAAGAVVGHEPVPGKGRVVRRMLREVDADVYLMVDGDDTYDASVAPSLVASLVERSLDVVHGLRVTTDPDAYPFGRRFGNRLIRTVFALAAGAELRDPLTGYRLLSRRFVDAFPCNSNRFELETELNFAYARLGIEVLEVETSYRARPVGSVSKLNTFRDGLRILSAIAREGTRLRATRLFAGRTLEKLRNDFSESSSWPGPIDLAQDSAPPSSEGSAP